ncbi:MAG TPA: aminoglycoside phosphotransferase [Methylococcaceae bacterium]|nr:aminoglycoside phosphotransferase [Methylococcaceae bacterium]
MIPSDLRLLTLLDWLENDCLLPVSSCKPASNDASFRRYFRVIIEGDAFIVMDAPPDKEDIIPFMDIALLFKQAGVNTPRILHHNLQEGFILLEDFGSTWLLDALDNTTAGTLYRQALLDLLPLHTHPALLQATLPAYDAALLHREMGLFEEWFVEQYLDDELPPVLWENVQALLIANALEQPRVCVHRDYHSRNIMVLPDGELGVLDFQDAVLGALTYDLVSLLRDCYISWPEAQVDEWLRAYFDELVKEKVVDVDYAHFKRWFDLMGVQRHLKAIGIFARLHLRDGKSDYLNAIPRTLQYVIAVSRNDPALYDFYHFLMQRIAPAIEK